MARRAHLSVPPDTRRGSYPGLAHRKHGRIGMRRAIGRDCDSVHIRSQPWPPSSLLPYACCPPAVSPVVRWNLAHPIRAFCPVSCSFCRSSAATGLGLAAPACLWLWRSARREGHADGEPSVRSAGGGADAAMRAGDGIRTLPCSRIADGPGAPTRGTPTRTTAGGEDHAHSILARGRLCRELPDYAGIRGSECCSAHGARR